MPQVAVAAVAAAAAYGASAAAAAGLAGAVAAGTISATTAAIIGAVASAVAGLVVSYAASLLLNSGAKKPSLTSSAQDQKQLVRSSVLPRRVVYGRSRVSGPIIYAASAGPDQGFLHLVIALTGHEIDAVETVWINDTPVDMATQWNASTGEVTAGLYSAPATETGRNVFDIFTRLALSGPRSRVFFRPYLGNQTAADLNLIADSPDGWDASCVLRGVSYLYVRLEYDKDLFQTGIPNISATIRGKKVYDPRTGATAWSDNWALCVLDYLRADHGLACADDEVDTASFTAAANLSDEAVPLDAGGITTQPRYRLNGTFQLDEKPIDIMEGLLGAGAGALTYVAGKYVLYGGAYIAPSASLTVSDFAGPVELQTMPRRADLFNSIKGTFVDPAKFWQPSEFPAQQDSAAIAADGEEVWKDIELKFVTDSTQAQRLTLQMLKRSRNPLTFKAPLRYEALTLKVWDTVAVTMPDFGWTNKPFRIVSWAFSPSEGTCTATFQEEQVAAYAWVYEAAANVPDVPDTTLISPLNIPAPTGVALVATTAVQADGSVVPAIEVTWTAAPHAFVTAYEVQWREAPDGPWDSREVAAPTTRLVIAPVISGKGYDVQVRAVASLVRSPWSGTSNGLAGADTTAPGVPTGLAASGTFRGISVTWTLPADLDMAAVEVYEATSSDPAGRVYVGESPGSGFLRSGLPFDATRYYWVRARDRSGNRSAFVGPASGTSAQVQSADFAASIAPVLVLDTLTTQAALDAPNNSTAVNKADGKLYTKTGGVWTQTVQPLGPNGTLTDAQIEALAAAKLTGQITETQITDAAISTPKLAAGAVVAEKLAAGAVTAETLAVGPAAGNVIWNSCCTNNRSGWSAAGSVPAPFWGAVGAGLNLADDIWRLPRWGTGGFQLSGPLAAGQWSDLCWYDAAAGRIPVQAGEWWEWQAKILVGDSASARLRVAFYDAAGTFLSEQTTGGPVSTNTGKGTTLDDYTLVWGKVQVPVGAVSAMPYFRMMGPSNGASASGPSAFCFFTQAQFCRANPNQTEATPWAPGGVTTVDGGMIRTNSITADHVNAGAIGADQLAANAVTAGKIAAGAISATELRVDSAIITQSLQLGDQIVSTGKIATGGVTGVSNITANANTDLVRPGSGWAAAQIAALNVTLEGEGRVLLHIKAPGFTFQTPGGTFGDIGN